MKTTTHSGAASFVGSTPIGPDTMIYQGQPISLASEIGILAVMHGALQSAIGTVDEALRAEQAYKGALSDLTDRHGR